MAGLRLEVQDFADLTRWRWALLEEATGALLFDHEVRRDQHPVGDLGPGGAHPAFGIGVCSRAPRRDLHHLDPRPGQHRVKRLGELPGPVPDQEPEPDGPLSQIHQQIPGLLHGPRPSGYAVTPRTWTWRLLTSSAKST